MLKSSKKQSCLPYPCNWPQSIFLLAMSIPTSPGSSYLWMEITFQGKPGERVALCLGVGV